MLRLFVLLLGIAIFFCGSAAHAQVRSSSTATTAVAASDGPRALSASTLSDTSIQLETHNPVAPWLVWGGLGVAATGVTLGLLSKLGYIDPLNDGSVRPPDEVDGLRSTGQTMATSADVITTVGALSLAAGITFWLTGTFDVESAPLDSGSLEASE